MAASRDSGLGREGIRWAIEDMTEVRLLAIRQPNRHKKRPYDRAFFL